MTRGGPGEPGSQVEETVDKSRYPKVNHQKDVWNPVNNGISYEQLCSWISGSINSRFQHFFVWYFWCDPFLWHSLIWSLAMMIKVGSYAFTDFWFAQMGSWINLWGFHRGFRLKPPPKGEEFQSPDVILYSSLRFGPTIPYWLNSDQSHVGLVMG